MVWEDLENDELARAVHESHRDLVVVWDLVVFLAIAPAAVLAVVQLRSFRRTTDLVVLTLGVLYLAIWYLLHVIDGFIQFMAVPLPPGYLVWQSVLWMIRVLSDVFIVWGIAQLRRRFFWFSYDEPRMIDLLFALPLFVALFYVGMLYAVDANWLCSKEILEAVMGHTAVGAAYYAVQFVGVLAYVVIFVAPQHQDKDLLPGRGKKYQRRNNWMDDWLDKFWFSMDPMLGCYAWSFVALGFRCFCEVVIAGEIDRTQPEEDQFEEIHVARCAVYGLASIPLTWMLVLAMRVGCKDCIAELRDEVEIEVEVWVEDRLNNLTGAGAKTAPPIDGIIGGLEKQVEDAAPTNEEDKLRHKLKLRYVKSLKGMYKDWTPILKQGIPSE